MQPELRQADIWSPYTLLSKKDHKQTRYTSFAMLSKDARKPPICDVSFMGWFSVCRNHRKRQCLSILEYSLADSNLKQPSGFASNPRSALQKATSRLKADRISEVAIRSELKEQSNLLNQASGSLQYFLDRGY